MLQFAVSCVRIRLIFDLFLSFIWLDFFVLYFMKLEKVISVEDTWKIGVEKVKFCIKALVALKFNRCEL